MTFSLINHAVANSPFNADAMTTSGIDTTGADLLVAVTAGFAGVATLTDSKGNTWTGLTTIINGTSAHRVRLWYCSNPVVGAGHTFTASRTGGYPAVAVQAWSGAKTATPFDQENGNTAMGASSLSTGSITPTQDDELAITASVSPTDGLTISSVNGGFTTTDVVQSGFGDSSATYGVAMAYLAQSAAAAANPTWTFTGTHNPTAVIASFRMQLAALTITPSAIPSNHSGPITLTVTGTGTSWDGSTVFVLSGVSGVTLVSQQVLSATSAEIVVTTE